MVSPYMNILNSPKTGKYFRQKDCGQKNKAGKDNQLRKPSSFIFLSPIFLSNFLHLLTRNSESFRFSRPVSGIQWPGGTVPGRKLPPLENLLVLSAKPTKPAWFAMHSLSSVSRSIDREGGCILSGSPPSCREKFRQEGLDVKHSALSRQPAFAFRLSRFIDRSYDSDPCSNDR